MKWNAVGRVDAASQAQITCSGSSSFARLLFGAALVLVAFADLAAQQTTARWYLEPDQVLGQTEDGDYEFETVGSVTVHESGVVYVTQPLGSTIHVFNSAGCFVRTFGRQGSVSGAMGSLARVGWAKGLLWVADTRHRRILTFRPSGAFVEYIRLSQDFSEPGTFLARAPYGLLSDGSLLVIPRAGSRAVVDGMIERVPLIRQKPDAHVTDTLGWRELGGTVLAIPSPTETRFLSNPLTDASIVAFHPDGDRLTIIDRRFAQTEEGATVQLRHIDIVTGQQRVVSLEYLPKPMEEQWFDTAVNQIVEAIRRPPSLFPDEAAAEAAVRQLVRKPQFHVPVTGALISRDGDTWLRREVSVSDSVEWTVISNDGVAQATVFIPPDFRVHFVAGDKLWGVTNIPNNRQVVSRFRIVR